MKPYLTSQQTETPLGIEHLNAASSGILLFKKRISPLFDENVICNPY
jgi:hypothetical protein